MSYFDQYKSFRNKNEKSSLPPEVIGKGDDGEIILSFNGKNHYYFSTIPGDSDNVKLWSHFDSIRKHKNALGRAVTWLESNSISLKD